MCKQLQFKFRRDIISSRMFTQIAIDGPTASGKGTVAKMLAKNLGFLYLDTGAIYRGIAVFFLESGLTKELLNAFVPLLDACDIFVTADGGDNKVMLNGKDITERIRENEVSVTVPIVATLIEVQEKVHRIQRKIATLGNIVCEGREVTSVVFPNADFKFYLTASIGVRTYRRYMQMRSKGEPIPLSQIKRQIRARDEMDMNRENCPLVQVPDAIRVDTSHANPYQSTKQMERLVRRRLGM